MEDVGKKNITKNLAKHLLEKLGNYRPTKSHVVLVEKLLLKTTTERQMIFHEALTERELSCLLLAAKGNTMEEIAEILSVKSSTVETWYKKIKEKLFCRSIAQAVFEGIRYGYIKPQGDK